MKFDLVELYDIYSDLLTDKQKMYFEDYYFDNLSLTEISENYKVSRNAVHNSLKDTEEKLVYYEEKLKIHYKNDRIKSIVTKIDDERIKKELEELI